MLKLILTIVLITFVSCTQSESSTKKDNKNKHEITNTMTEYWKEFQQKNPEYSNTPQPQSFFFCDNKKDADECAELVVKKIKQATSPSVWWFKKNNESFPKIGDLAIVTNWNGEPKAIIRTKKTEVVKFKDITPKYAYTEGEGDKTLEYWKKTHWDYYTNEMKEFNESPSEDMEIVCEYFETIW
ncbi:ASCH domain-containing protein [Chryseobacterium turcicum]|uniref:ASCH domain-containing protein n=1 Tax=Chryseobacterium turcicum TaxID=2898076 RepID=A0A9Q3V6Z5_9FLAO|nr:ASCH domain-containing protein [Chryseobacterium turcicum]MCD1118459.1 ASCH domain-containing protein [Chryseobacterium turcicum]